MKPKILITGASGGIGRACALKLAEKGMDLVLHYHRNLEAIQALKESLKESEASVEVIQFDLSNRDFIEVIEKVEVDGLVHTAALLKPGLFLSLPLEEIEMLIQANLTNTLLMARLLLPKFFRKKKGKMIFFSSTVTSKVFRGQSIYAAAKGGIEAFVRALAYEMGGKGIRINCISPGPVDTPMLRPTLNLAGDDLKKSLPLKRLGRPEEVASLVAFLLSEEADYINGANFTIDGGYGLG